jgi:hypothetical protein
MKRNTKVLIGLIFLLLIFSMACNLLNAVLPSGNDSSEIVVESEEGPEEITQPEDEPIENEQDESPTQEPPAEESLSEHPYAVFVGETAITYYSEKDMAPRVVNLDGYVLSAVPSPVGGKLAIVRVEKEDQSGMLWLDLLDMATGQLTTITPLANDQTVLESWETAEIGQPPREAFFATILSDPLWTPNGSAVVFISAHQGLYTRPYSLIITTGEIIDLLLGGEAHYYAPSISPDGEYIVVPSATSFGTGAGFAMDSFSAARVSGGEAWLIEDVSEASNLLTSGWLDDQTVVFSAGDMFASGKNLRAVNIYSGSSMEIIGANDYADNVAVGPYTGTVLFTTMMADFADYIEGETITKNALFSWNIGMQEYVELTGRVGWGSFVKWNPQTNCFYADLFTGGQEADFIQPYTSASTINETTCRPLAANVKNIPEFSHSLEYFVWMVGEYDSSAPAGVYVQSFTENREIRLTEMPVPFAWHPTDDLLTFTQENRVYNAAAPDFTLTQVLEVSEIISSVYWVVP